MNKEFVASNGITLSFDDQGRFMYSEDGDEPRLVGMSADRWWGFTESSRNAAALAEYYRAKEDERLGRWRWPENSNYVVYPDRLNTTPPRGAIRVWNEKTGASRYYLDRGGVDGIGGQFDPAAAAYFDAHPEPKPWYDAAEGEVWELEFKAGTHAWFVNGPYFQSTKTLTNIYKTDPDILSARKIWPQDD